jgi:hypothetical protein
MLRAQKKFFNTLTEQQKATLSLCGFEIFRENNCVQRNKFFSQPFIQFLWNIYIVEQPVTII